MEIEAACSYEALNFDEACVRLSSKVDSPNLWLYTLSSDCAACPYTRVEEFTPLGESSIKVGTAESQSWRVIESTRDESHVSATSNDGLHCQISPKIGEFGIYRLTVASNKSCNLDTIREPINQYTPLAIASGLVILSLLGLSLLRIVKRRRSEDAPAASNAGPKRRVRSLDTVRGMSILLMIFVNNGAAGYRVLEHATWDGLLLGDLVFPCFMWIMGVCIPLSVSGQLSRGGSRFAICRGIVKRSFYLFLIGICLNSLGGNTQLENIRIFGVLQRFSVAYLATAIVYATTYRPAVNTKQQQQHPALASIRDISILLPQWVIALLVLAAHCALVFLLPVPGCPKGYLGPGGRHADGKYFNCSGGATGHIDRVVLGVGHIYQRPTTDSVYGSGPFDPEGVLGSLTSIFQVFLGIQAGQTLREYRGWRSRVLRWLLWALLFAAIGAVLHFTRAVPVNKNLWSISFVMVTSCFCLSLLSACYLLIDVAGLWQGGPFRIPGTNALLMYVGHQIFYAMLPFHWRIGTMGTHGWLLAECLWCVGLWTCIAYALHRRRIYVTL